MAGEEGDREPDDGEGERRLPGDGEKAAEEGRDPFAAPKPDPDRKQMAKKAPSAAASSGVPGAKWAAIKTATVPFKKI